MKENNTFVALCTESFTFNHAAICSVAMVKVINSVIVQEFNSLIRPVAGKGNMLDTFLSVFGGSKYANAPEFPEVLRLMEIFTGEFYQFNLSSCIRQQNSLTAQFVSFSLANLANIFYPPPIFTIINLCLL